ncbi:endo-N-acetylneuraminidase [Klebsiella virus vB_KpnM-20]|nr:endo-N-acetylneuraminidase [Klebsiella virus vB_KpnM-20]
MNPQFSQPGGSVSKDVNKQSIARVYGVKMSEVAYLKVGLLVDGYKILYDKTTQTCWYRGTATGTVISWETSVLVTSTGSFNLQLADILKSLGSSEENLGGSLVHIDNATVRELAESNIFMKMTRADINTMLNTPGAEVSVDYALQALIDAGYKSVRFPHGVKGIYALNGSVTLPGGFTIYGECSKPYTITDDSSFVGKGTVIRKASGADYIFGPGSVFRIYGCILDGRDKTRPLINQTNQVRGGILFNCGVYRFLYGIGSYSYTSIQVGKSSICANQDGVYNLIDSRIIDTTINANSRHGVNMQTGANNNIFQNVRNEWNEGIGYNIAGSVGNIITGELVDRSGSANFAVTGGGVVIGDLFSQRPGKNSAEGSTYNTHFYIEGSGSYIMLSNVKTRTGVDDGGSGNLTPERVITTGGTATDVTIHATGCDLTGYTVSALREIVTIDNKLFRNNTGVSDTVTTGLYQMFNGRQNIGGTKTNQVLSSGVGSTLTITFSHPSLVDPTSNPIPRPKRRTILIESNTSAGVVSTYEIGILIRRVSASAAVSTLSGKEFSSPSGVWGVSGATGVTVAVSVNADASTVTVQLTSVDGVGRFIDATLLPQ